MRIWSRSTAAVLAIAVAAAGAVAQQTPVAAPAPAASLPPISPAQRTFTEVCASCHGTTLAGARAPSVFADNLLAERSDDELLRIVQNGLPDRGMPLFKDQYSEDQIRQIIAYLRVQGGRLKDRPTVVIDPNDRIVESRKQKFRIEVVTVGLDTPWGGTFLPDGRMLVTERAGALRIIDRDGKLRPEPVKGTPATFVRQDGGYLDVALHPNYRRNGWIYLSYSDVRPGVTPEPGSDKAPKIAPPTMTVLIRGRISKNNEWTDEQTIFRAKPEVYSIPSDHYGSRFVFDRQGRLFYSLGEKHDRLASQDLTTPIGKIHRVRDDGAPLPDNPFVNRAGADPTVWSYGHRNPQGLAFNPVTGDLWASEHGPTGGDEINVIEKGGNYGWGLVSMGIEPDITQQHGAGMIDPVAYYTPTVAPAGMSFYTGDKYPAWKNNLFVATLAGQKLLRIETSGKKIVAQETLFEGYGRVRDVKTGPDGLLYVWLQNPTGMGTGVAMSAQSAGMIVRLVPLSKSIERAPGAQRVADGTRSVTWVNQRGSRIPPENR